MDFRRGLFWTDDVHFLFVSWDSLLFTVVDYIFGTKFNSVNMAKQKQNIRQHKTDVHCTVDEKINKQTHAHIHVGIFYTVTRTHVCSCKICLLACTMITVFCVSFSAALVSQLSECLNEHVFQLSACFFSMHSEKKWAVFWSLCAICKVVPICIQFLCVPRTSTQFKVGSDRICWWFLFGRWYGESQNTVQTVKWKTYWTDGAQHPNSALDNNGHCTVDQLNQMNWEIRFVCAFVLHKWWPHNFCAWNYQYIQFADKYMNCVVNEFNLHGNNGRKEEKKSYQTERTKLKYE